MKPDLFLEGARLGPRSPTLIQYDEAPRQARLPRRFRPYAVVDLAHVVMLVEEGILPPDRGARLLTGLLDILDSGPERFPWDPRSGSYLVQVERFLEGRVGQNIAGLLQTARSRNDQDAAADRVFTRDLLLDLVEGLLRLERALVERAGTYADAVMPGYTHLQHAQPWTFGHYLLREASIFERDLQRLRGAYARTNLSVLGGAANAGTSWPVNRRRVAALLGHDGLVINSCDAGAFARDFLEEDVACLAILMGNLGRLATDLYLWSSWEFGFVEVADGLAGTSSIMPQKKNPHALERVKALGGQAAGWLAMVMGSQHGVCSTDLDFHFADDVLIPIGDATVGALRLMEETVGTLIVHTDVMSAKAGAYWITTSHLADELVRRFDLPFRTAHHVVGRFVKLSIEAGHRPDAPVPELLSRAAREMGAPEITLTAADLRRLLDARHFVETRISEGSVQPGRVREHLDLVRGLVDRHSDWLGQETRRVRQAIADLEKLARSLATTPSGG
jgi:argininosuccinate lyase